MLYAKKITLLALVAFSYSSSSLPSMSACSSTDLQSAQQITHWPSLIYDNAYQGANYNHGNSQRILDAEKKRALLMTHVQAEHEQLTEEQRVILDWEYALQKSEMTLLTKPFTTWSIEDIRTLSSWITRLTTDNPLEFRSEPTIWAKRELSADEEQLADKLLARKYIALKSLASQPHLLAALNSKTQENFTADSHFSTAEEEFLKSSVHFFCLPSEIVPELKKALLQTQKELKKLGTLSSPQEKEEKAFLLGTEFHHALVKIHPAQEGNKRLARLCMWIIHCQNGITPYPINFAEEYTASCLASLHEDSFKPFEKFYKKTYTEGQEVSNKADRAFQQLKGKNDTARVSENELIAALAKTWNLSAAEIAKLKDDAEFKTLLESSRVSSATPVPPAAPLHVCAQCGTKDAKKMCARCKITHYCSQECQKNHWENHKQTCKSPSSK